MIKVHLVNYSEIVQHAHAASAAIAEVASKITMPVINMSRNGLDGAAMLGTSVKSVRLSTIFF